MALRDFESFDNINSSFGSPGSGFGAKGWIYGGNSPRITVGGGRFGTDAFGEWDNTVSASKIYDSQSTWILGCAYMPGNYGYDGIFQFYDNAGSSYGISIVQNGAGKIQARLGPWTGTLLATGTALLVPGYWHFLEVKVVIHNSAGSVIVRVDEVEDINVSGIDTQYGSNATVDQIILGDVQSGSARGVWDDYYLCDGTGSAPFNTFLGDCRVCSLLPSGNGNSSQFTGSDGNSTDNYALVDEAGAASSSDYVQDSTVGHKDTYAFADLPSSSGTVHAVKPVMVVTKDDAGSRSVASVVRVSATEVDSANHSLTTSYEWVQDIRLTKPGGGSWSISDVNGMEAGIKVTV